MERWLIVAFGFFLTLLVVCLAAAIEVGFVLLSDKWERRRRKSRS